MSRFDCSPIDAGKHMCNEWSGGKGTGTHAFPDRDLQAATRFICRQWTENSG